MNQSKGSTANTEADASKDTSKHNPFSNILKSGSANNQGFCSAIVRSLGLAVKAESSIYMHTKSKDYEGVKAELLTLAKSFPVPDF